jgi:uncharacterized phage-associated protein
MGARGKALAGGTHGHYQIGGGTALWMMTARLDSVCKFICESGNWRVTNLQAQKILYLAYMYYLGNKGERLTDAFFEAWDYGPVEPSVYQRVRMFGSDPIQDVFYRARNFKVDDPRRAALTEVCDFLIPLRPSALIDITHWEEGAWAKNYVPGVKGIRISDTDIAAEYKCRLAAKPRHADHFSAV